MNLCLDASQELAQAQIELAQYRPGNNSVEFQALWGKCRETMARIESLRAEASRHVALHTD
ncbi:MAG TPA: hypothetical protein VKR43_20865 [Bryobacteraceae bacterium]|nr:hypothetical protein [Bryobacteraceae bacterium]